MAALLWVVQKKERAKLWEDNASPFNPYTPQAATPLSGNSPLVASEPILTKGFFRASHVTVGHSQKLGRVAARRFAVNAALAMLPHPPRMLLEPGITVGNSAHPIEV